MAASIAYPGVTEAVACRSGYAMSAAQAAATPVWAAISHKWEGTGGKYLENCSVAEPYVEGKTLMWGHAPHVYDAEGAKQLWELSMKAVGLA